MPVCIHIRFCTGVHVLKTRLFLYKLLLYFNELVPPIEAEVSKVLLLSTRSTQLALTPEGPGVRLCSPRQVN